MSTASATQTVDASKFLRVLIATTLIVASAFKYWSLIENVDNSHHKILLPVQVVYASVVVEFALGMWLLRGPFTGRKWLASLALFVVFAGLSLYQGLNGAKVCNCFGYLSVSPWLTFSLDLAVLFALACNGPILPTQQLGRKSRTRVILAFGSVALAALLSAGTVTTGALAHLENIPVWYNTNDTKARDSVWPAIEPSLRAILSPLGTQPRESGDIRVRVDSIEEYLNEIARNYHINDISNVKRYSQQAFAEIAGAGAYPVPYIVRAESGQLQTVIGGYSDEADEFYQVLTTDAGQALVPKRPFLEAAREIWQVAPTRALVPFVDIGKAKLSVDRLFHTFGMVKPYSSVTTAFEITNGGSGRIELDVSASCGCITTTFASGRNALEPGETTKLNVVADISRTNLRQTIRIGPRGSRQAAHLTLELVAVQRETLNQSSNAIDFGLLDGDKPVKRVVRLSEVPADRFSVSTIDNGGLPVTWTIAEHRQRNPELRDYEIEFELRPLDVSPGQHKVNLTVGTTSRHRPKVEISASAKKPANVSMVPSTLNFGAISAGHQTRKVVAIRFRRSHDCIVSAPKETKGAFRIVEISQLSPTEHSVTVECNGSVPGFDKQTVELTVASEAHLEKLELQCTVFVAKQ